MFMRQWPRTYKEATIVRAIKSIILLGMLISSHAVSAAAPVFATSAESKYARELIPPKGKAIVYIYQRNADGTGISPTIWLNNYQIGQLVPGSFTVWQLAPGKLEVRINGTDPATLTLRSEAGKVYLFRLTVTPTGTGPKAQLESLPESYRSDLAAAQLIKNPRQVTTAAVLMPAVPAKPAAPVTPSATKPVATPPATSSHPTPTVALEPGGFSVMLKTGTMTLSQGSQSILGVDSSFDTKATGTYNIAVDYQNESGLTMGGELMGYKTAFTQLGNTSSVNVLTLFGTAKQYFNIEASLQPYIGAGLGAATTDVSGGGLTGNTSGFAYEVMGGVEYRVQNLGFVGEVKYIGAKTKDSTDNKIDVSGTAILAGIAYHF